MLIAGTDPNDRPLDMLSLATFLYEDEAKTGPLLEIPAEIYRRRIIRPAPSAEVEGARGVGAVRPSRSCPRTTGKNGLAVLGAAYVGVLSDERGQPRAGLIPASAPTSTASPPHQQQLVRGGARQEHSRSEEIPMNLIKLDAVRRHTRRELTPDQAKSLVSHPNISVVKAQAAALSLHPWGNTPEEWLRLEACLVLIEERQRGPELNLDVDAPDKVAGVLSAAASAYQASAVELTATWQDQRVPMIWAAIAGELDLAAWKIEKIVKQRLDPRQSPRRKK